jgi:CubicO group peptidase (beta-lactamase class C family)
MRRSSLATVIVIGTLAASSSAARAQNIVGVRDARAIRADSVFQRFDRTDSPGCALGVYQDDKILYARGYGMASLELGVALSSRSVLDVGSISKQFTAMSILLLQKDGKLSLDDPIRKYIPELPPYADKITLRRALSQTSGIRDLYVLWEQTGRSFRGDTVDALRVITRSAEPNFTPGDKYLYSNSAWILAAQIVYRLTGKTLAEFAQERIFGPLGMRDTRYLADASMIIPNLATAYAPRQNGFRVARSGYDGAIMGAGAVHTTVEDFGRWLANYDSAKVGDRGIIETMTTATKLNDGTPAKSGPTLAYAVGLTVGTLRGLRVVAHGGSWAGYRGHFLRFPDQHFAVATFCNLTTSGPDSLARKVAGIYLADRMQPDSASMWVAQLEGTPRASVSPSNLRGLAGVWRNVERGEVRRTRVAGDTLFLSSGGARQRMVPLEGAAFRVGSATEVRFEGDAARPTTLLVKTTSETAVYTRVDSVALTAAQLAEYAGDYRNDEVETTQTWKVENGQLAIYANNRRLGVLEPSYKDGFTRGDNVIDVQRDAKGKITGYVVEAGRVRHLRFVRER